MLDPGKVVLISAVNSLAIVTGTSSGIGAGLAQELLNQGWQVLGIARRDADIDSPNYIHLVADLGDRSVLESVILPTLIEHIKQRPWERVSLVNNAASIGALKGLTEISATMLAKVLDVNATAPCALMGVVSKQVSNNTWLRIVNVSSGAAQRGIPGLADYCASKAALRLAGMTLATEFEQSNRARAAILSYEPGVVDTEMQVKARTPSGGFPSQEVFQGFHNQGMLQPVGAVIQEMIDFMSETKNPAFTERRFSP